MPARWPWRNPGPFSFPWMPYNEKGPAPQETAWSAERHRVPPTKAAPAYNLSPKLPTARDYPRLSATIQDYPTSPHLRLFVNKLAQICIFDTI